MKAAYLKRGDMILVDKTRYKVRAVEPTHKDGVCIRLRGRKPLYCRWDNEVQLAQRESGADVETGALRNEQPPADLDKPE